MRACVKGAMQDEERDESGSRAKEMGDDERLKGRKGRVTRKRKERERVHLSIPTRASEETQNEG